MDTVDDGLLKARAKQKKRNYLGASGLGHACGRSIQYDFLHSEKKKFSGRILRVFERGHAGEKLVASFLRKSGFKISVCDKNRRQYEFSQVNGLLKGHIDGIIKKAPAKFRMLTGFGTPAIWENKVLEQKYFNQLKRKGLKDFSSGYYGQAQLYMAYFNLHKNPALFTALNPNNMEVYAELVPYDVRVAQQMSDRGVLILKGISRNQTMDRVSNKKNWVCNMCSWAEKCFGAES